MLYNIYFKYCKHRNILYFNPIIAYLCHNWPLTYFSLLNTSANMAERGRNMLQITTSRITMYLITVQFLENTWWKKKIIYLYKY